MSAYKALHVSKSRDEDAHDEIPSPEGVALTGNLHSVETFGTLDGPGIRYVLFFQGCHLRCLFCQNRDTWQPAMGRKVGVDELLGDILRYKPFMDSSGGGITASGGDPILQPRFIAALFRAARAHGIHTALDTSGLSRISPAVEELLAYTDLVLLDVKHIDPETHRKLTGRDNELVLRFAEHLDRLSRPVWIRHVIVPGFSDSEASARATAEYLSRLGNIERVELLPYHEYGKHKWEAVGEDYPLEGVDPPSKACMAELRAVFSEYNLPV